jgi:hypothetical protein
LPGYRRLVFRRWRATFALLLFLATVVTGVYWLAERFFSCRSAKAAGTLEEQAVQRRAELDRMGIQQVDGMCRGQAAASSCSPGGWTGRRDCFR